MAIRTIKTTYALDIDTVRALEAMARRWKVSKSEALRRAIRTVAIQELSPGSDALQALDRLQQALDLDADAAARWEETTHAERQASGRRLEKPV